MPEPGQTTPSPSMPRRPKRPLPLKLVGCLFVLWSLLGWLRLFTAMGTRELIVSRVNPGLYAYLLLAGLAWGLLGLPVLWGLLTRAGWTPTILQVAAGLYPVWYWLERWLLWQDPNAHSNWPLMLLLTAVWAGLVVWGLRSARSKNFFTQNHHRK